MGSVGLCCHLPADRGNTAPAGAAGGGWGPAARWTPDSTWGGPLRQRGERPPGVTLHFTLFVLSRRQGPKGKETWLCPWRVAGAPGSPPPGGCPKAKPQAPRGDYSEDSLAWTSASPSGPSSKQTILILFPRVQTQLPILLLTGSPPVQTNRSHHGRPPTLPSGTSASVWGSLEVKMDL